MQVAGGMGDGQTAYGIEIQEDCTGRMVLE